MPVAGLQSRTVEARIAVACSLRSAPKLEATEQSSECERAMLQQACSPLEQRLVARRCSTRQRLSAAPRPAACAQTPLLVSGSVGRQPCWTLCVVACPVSDPNISEYRAERFAPRRCCAKKVQRCKTLTGWPDEASAQHPVGPTSPPGPRRTKLPWARQWGSTSGQLQGQLAALTAAASSQQTRFGRRPQLNQPSMRLEKHTMVRQSPRTRQSKRCPSQSTPLLASNQAARLQGRSRRGWSRLLRTVCSASLALHG